MVEEPPPISKLSPLLAVPMLKLLPVLVAVTDGYPSVNGAKINGSVVLNEGDLIECGATTMQFELRDPA